LLSIKMRRLRWGSRRSELSEACIRDRQPLYRESGQKSYIEAKSADFHFSIYKLYLN
jgi:hypothetical protein